MNLIVYFNRLNITELDCNKMLAIIAYKTYFRVILLICNLIKDLYILFLIVKNYLLKKNQKIFLKKISEVVHKIERTKNEHLKTIEELDVVFEDKKLIDYWNRKQELSEADKKKIMPNGSRQ